RRFYRVALQRFEDAQILLENDRTTGAMYLAGYTVECGLKALLLANVPSRQHPNLVRSFYGKIGHDLEWLKKELRRRGVEIPPETADHLRRVTTWSTHMRYDPALQTKPETRGFIQAADQVIRWVERKL